MSIKKKLNGFRTKWGAGGLARSLERKRARKAANAGNLGVPPDLLSRQFPQINGLPVFHVPNGQHKAGRRVNLITDSINAGSLYGGVGTALILACEICRVHQVSLRIVTRTEPADPKRLKEALALYGIEMPANCEMEYIASHGSFKRLDVGPDDVFLTTSWWTTQATLRTIAANKIRYLIQEDERMFYAHGDERLRCDAVLQNPALHLIVNSSFLHEHFLEDKVHGYESRAQFFEPAFPSNVYFPRQHSGKRKVFFYARPHNPRNLFWFGIEVLREAVSQGVFPSSEWDICMVGNDVPACDLLHDHPYQVLQGLSWAEYAELIGQMDLGLTLMSTPHPSYPPLDLAASGALVVTNRFGVKRDLNRYSDAIVCADLNVESMVSALKEAARAATHLERAQNRRHDSKLPDSWQESLQSVVKNFKFN
jgi:hypothetical protein